MRKRFRTDFVRRFTATVTRHDGFVYTATITGDNPGKAEEAYLVEHPDVKRVIVMSEQH